MKTAKKHSPVDMEKKPKRKRLVKVPPNDGTNTPVPGKIATNILSESEAALFKQAETLQAIRIRFNGN
ncbi:hypothetical protein [Mucilaginibacter sp. dw_454]|uniref:hypothetical protein n=1 Tax=Mucilaginibacter sp. dw_454 TaxID=2720079 RepID=UPI001BD46A3E|nr:hypothetical protein [Mucilaginibacter sp. dw_454]